MTKGGVCESLGDEGELWQGLNHEAQHDLSGADLWSVIADRMPFLNGGIRQQEGTVES
jgi:hypothetical protein